MVLPAEKHPFVLFLDTWRCCRSSRPNNGKRCAGDWKTPDKTFCNAHGNRHIGQPPQRSIPTTPTFEPATRFLNLSPSLKNSIPVARCEPTVEQLQLLSHGLEMGVFS
jgi:hypothetical protein